MFIFFLVTDTALLSQYVGIVYVLLELGTDKTLGGGRQSTGRITQEECYYQLMWSINKNFGFPNLLDGQKCHYRIKHYAPILKNSDLISVISLLMTQNFNLSKNDNVDKGLR